MSHKTQVITGLLDTGKLWGIRPTACFSLNPVFNVTGSLSCTAGQGLEGARDGEVKSSLFRVTTCMCPKVVHIMSCLNHAHFKA